MSLFSRRHFLAMAPSGLLLPRRLLASPPTASTEQKFLFIYVKGGWDTTMLFNPCFDYPLVDMEPDAQVAEVNGITFVDHELRPEVREFFENYGNRSCMINGMEVRSITHERCRRILMTGGSEGTMDDWAVTLASQGGGEYPVPHMVLSGPAFSANYMSSVVRVGSAGQLSDLLDGKAVSNSNMAVELPGAEAQDLAMEFVARRVEEQGAAAGRPERIRSLYLESIENLGILKEMSQDIDLEAEMAGCRRDISSDAAVAFNAFEQGLSRCAMTQDEGWCSAGWDTHTGNDMQIANYSELFGYLNTAMADLDSRASFSGGSLADEVTIVVISEMGRHPTLSGDGRGHWTVTSALLIGGGIRGGQVIGEMDENFLGKPVDLASGEIDAGGTSLLPAHLGATLLRIGDLDPGDFMQQPAPIEAVLP
jgi:hypothetical protein